MIGSSTVTRPAVLWPTDATAAGPSEAAPPFKFSDLISTDMAKNRPVFYQRRSKRCRKITAAPFITNKKANNTMIAPEVRSTNARSGLFAHK